ncbi:conserved hypothetical protein [uncultured Desulfobacterium sp.]|uniref:Uncharacterized protein n=1 Tax=uncultured Desulfobacterium sp. TaxID=201089 RepID=A0A445MSX4_9BACT|nr:conserved hypothetical protein [uncultured Desulfobacterium sp.]
MIITSRHDLAWRIRAVFDGKLPPREYLTPDIRRKNPGWGDEIFNRTIEKMEFFLPTGHRIVLAGMEQYNFFVEAAQSTQSRSGTQILAFWLCGKLPGEDIVEMWRVGNGKKVIRDQKPWRSEWGGGPTRGWKKGLPGRPVSTIVR